MIIRISNFERDTVPQLTEAVGSGITKVGIKICAFAENFF